MISHFKLSTYENYFYLDVAAIKQGDCGLELVGTLGDGSAEASIEVEIGEVLVVNILAVWDAKNETLCQRYDQCLLEAGVAEVVEGFSFRSLKSYDQKTGCWQEQVVALDSSVDFLTSSMDHLSRAHQWISEPGPLWQQAVC